VNQTKQHDYADGPVAQDYGELIGVPFKVFLSNGVVEKVDEKTGKVMTEITDLPGLIACILQARVLHPRKLSGDELKFIRVALRLKSAEVAEDILDVSPEHYSRCETGTKTLSTSTEKFYRMRVFLQAGCKHKAVQELKEKMQKENAEIDATEEIKEAFEAFQSVFFDMKIKNIFPVGDELAFSFVHRPVDRRPRRARGKDDGKWHKKAA
jgi:DNA-binding transcriptional regulator YiaG